MNNYVYIISSLPVISGDQTRNNDIHVNGVISDIREQLSDADREMLDFFLKGFEPDSLTEDYYRKAAAHKNRFIKMYATMDMNVRNAKARYLNGACGRPIEADTIRLSEGENEFEQAQVLDAILHGDDILAREKKIDDLMWEYVDEISLFDYFDMNAVLAFTAKLMICDRWLKLDVQKGREMFRTLVDGIQSTFKGVEFQK